MFGMCHRRAAAPAEFPLVVKAVYLCRGNRGKGEIAGSQVPELRRAEKAIALAEFSGGQGARRQQKEKVLVDRKEIARFLTEGRKRETLCLEIGEARQRKAVVRCPEEHTFPGDQNKERTPRGRSFRVIAYIIVMRCNILNHAYSDTPV